MDKYFLEAYRGIQFRHGGVGNTDAETILKQEGYIPLLLPDNTGVFLRIKRWLTANKFLRTIPKGSMVVAHQPIYPRMYRYLVRNLLRKKIRLVLLVADIDGLKDDDPAVLAKETDLFRSCRHFIVHNSSMEAFIRKYSPQAHIVQLGPFDFLAEPFIGLRSNDQGLNFSGNLAKSTFLERIAQFPTLQFHIYGDGCTKAMQAQPNLHYHGTYLASQLPSIMQGSYGLIWDGESVDEPIDPIGRYMQYINHHKLSLYILAGMPVIAPVFAGSADFIRKHQIGWLINSLQEIPALMSKIDLPTYQETSRRMAPLAQLISTGMQLRNALTALEAISHPDPYYD